MPLYDYTDAFGHTTESREGIETVSIPCPICGAIANRHQVYREQFMQAETGPTGGKKNEIPPSDMRLGQDVSDFVEASGEVDDIYDRHHRETGVQLQKPNFFRRGIREAQKRGAKVKF